MLEITVHSAPRAARLAIDTLGDGRGTGIGSTAGIPRMAMSGGELDTTDGAADMSTSAEMLARNSLGAAKAQVRSRRAYALIRSSYG
jgi:hypothetical protein